MTFPPALEDLVLEAGVQYQTLCIGDEKIKAFFVEEVKSKAATYLVLEAGVRYQDEGQKLSAFVSNTDASGMLSIPAGNVDKTLRNAGVRSQRLQVGRRSMKVYEREDVERVVQKRAERSRSDG